MASREKTNSSLRIVEDVIGCKWSLQVVDCIRRGKKRPGEIKRDIAGISEKVLNERLKKLARYELILRKVYPEVPPRVEYRFSPKGRKFLKVLDVISEFAK